MQVNPYLHFNGNCEAVFKFYAESLNGKISTLLPHEGTPAEQQVPAEWRKKIVHAHMTVGDTILMGSDQPPEHYTKPQGFSVTLQVAKPEEAERAFQALSKNGTVTMPMQQTFFASRFGMLVDQFGIPWMVVGPPAA